MLSLVDSKLIVSRGRNGISLSAVDLGFFTRNINFANKTKQSRTEQQKKTNKILQTKQNRKRNKRETKTHNAQKNIANKLIASNIMRCLFIFFLFFH